MSDALLIEMGASRLYHGDDRDAGVVLVRIPEALYLRIHAAVNANAQLLEALKRALPRVQALYDSMGGRDNELVLENIRAAIALATSSGDV